VSGDNALPLIVYGKDGISLGKYEVFNLKYKAGTATWSLDREALTANPCEGEITFSQLCREVKGDPHAYVGNIVSGTLQFPPEGATDANGNGIAGTWEYTAFIGDLPHPRQASPLGYNSKTSEFWTMASHALTLGFLLVLVGQFTGGLRTLGGDALKIIKEANGIGGREVDRRLEQSGKAKARSRDKSLNELSQDDIERNELVRDSGLDEPSELRRLKQISDLPVEPEVEQRLKDDAAREAMDEAEKARESPSRSLEELEAEGKAPGLEGEIAPELFP
jgi:hypothetical protein